VAAEQCDNGVDDDGDGDVDCDDADCAEDEACAEAVELCDNGIDDDGDGKVDCDDADCALADECASEGEQAQELPKVGGAGCLCSIPRPAPSGGHAGGLAAAMLVLTVRLRRRPSRGANRP
jgi:hypothetical protein